MNNLDKNFYTHQIDLMAKRYSLIFKKRNFSWNKYYNEVVSKLDNNMYWVWCFMCGFETIIKEENSFKIKNRKVWKQFINKNTITKIASIIGSTKKVEKYVESLPKSNGDNMFHLK